MKKLTKTIPLPMRKFVSVFLILFASFPSYSQFGFERWDSLHVSRGGNNLLNPWSGGFSSPMFSPIDLNQDGLKDLFVFDRTCHRVLTFINAGIPGVVKYTYNHAYAQAFPPMRYFALLRDYNCDGKEDIFTYTSGGFKVYRNDYTVTSGLQFTLVTPFLMEDFTSGPINVYTSSADLPAIDDLDGDGDLDILTLAVGGGAVIYHRNYSKENYGHCDSLDYTLESTCWGNVFLSSFSNTATLGISCRTSPLPPPEMGGLHGAATFLTFDAEGDGDKELVVGDVGFKNLLYLHNGGGAAVANITAQDTTFPANFLSSIPVSIQNFPGAYYMDVDNDGVKDLLVSPSSPGLSENYKGVWFFKNTNLDNWPDFEFVTDSLFQDNFIETGDGNNPLVWDENSDGHLDLLFGNYGMFNPSGIYFSSLHLYRNIGTTGFPSYNFISNNYESLHSPLLQDLYPTAGDLDSDGDQDLVVGNNNGNLSYYENIGGAGNPAVFAAGVHNYSGIDVGLNAAPQLADLNNDGKLDLAIGRASGTISFFPNQGSSTSPSFSSSPESAFFGQVSVVDSSFGITGYASPYFFKINGLWKLFVGSQRGYIYFYSGIDGNLTGSFQLLDSMYFNEMDGCRLSVTGGDLDTDGRTDLVVGNYGGGCNIYRNTFFTGIPGNFPFSINRPKLFPNPSTEILQVNLGIPGEKRFGIEVSTIQGRVLFQQEKATSPFHMETSDLPDGLYFLKITSDHESFTEKFIVLH